MSKTEVQTLLGAYESVRNLSKLYIGNLNKEKIHNQIEINGIKFNSAYWIVTHLVWTERFLIIQGIGGKDMDDHWLDEYGFGSNPEEVKTKPEFEEILKLFDDIHSKAVEVLKETNDNQLDEPNYINATFGGKSDKRTVLKHAIRHEPMHIGQISWILKLNKVEMV
ncbi:MAG TPA: DinB family protein [Ignavibacteria bacterium]|jgi:hypothetical protein